MEEDKKLVPAEQIATGALNEYWDFIIKDIKNKSRLSGSKAKIKAYSDVIDTIQKHKSNWNVSYKQLLSGQPNNFNKIEPTAIDVDGQTALTEDKSTQHCDGSIIDFRPLACKEN